MSDNATFEAPPTAQISQKARAGAGWSLGSLVGRQLILLAATAVLARVLSAADYGLFGMVVAITALMQAFADLGLSWATIQRKEITRAQIDSLFLINAVFGLLLWIGSAFSGKLLVSFYHRPELAGIATVLGASFFFSGSAAQPLALLRRQMRFKQITVCEQWSTLAGAIMGVGVALSGFGYWALVIQIVVQQFVYALLLLLLSGYRPRLPRGVHGLAGLLSFGGYMAGYSAINYFSRNLDNVLVGRVCGADATRILFTRLFPDDSADDAGVRHAERGNDPGALCFAVRSRPHGGGILTLHPVDHAAGLSRRSGPRCLRAGVREVRLRSPMGAGSAYVALALCGRGDPTGAGSRGLALRGDGTQPSHVLRRPRRQHGDCCGILCWHSLRSGWCGTRICSR